LLHPHNFFPQLGFKESVTVRTTFDSPHLQLGFPLLLKLDPTDPYDCSWTHCVFDVWFDISGEGDAWLKLFWVMGHERRGRREKVLIMVEKKREAFLVQWRRREKLNPNF